MKFSVLLSVYKKENPYFLSCAFKSIWDDQSVKPDQIVLVQDGQLTDQLYQEIGRLKSDLSEVLTIVDLPVNVGLALALNAGLEYCSYELVARMDTDDLAMPERFEKQVDFMSKSTEIAVCSGQIEEWNQDFSERVSVRRLPVSHSDIVKLAKSRSPISHPAVMFRKSTVLNSGGYPEIYPEDYLLWGRMLAKGYKFANLPSVVLKMRVDDAIGERRGKRFLAGIFKTYSELHKIGFITRKEMIKNSFLRAFVSLSPVWLRKSIYKFAR